MWFIKIPAEFLVSTCFLSSETLFVDIPFHVIEKVGLFLKEETIFLLLCRTSSRYLLKIFLREARKDVIGFEVTRRPALLNLATLQLWQRQKVDVTCRKRPAWSWTNQTGCPCCTPHQSKSLLHGWRRQPRCQLLYPGSWSLCWLLDRLLGRSLTVRLLYLESVILFHSFGDTSTCNTIPIGGL